MRFSLRTLLILMLLGGPLVAVGWQSWEAYCTSLEAERAKKIAAPKLAPKFAPKVAAKPGSAFNRRPGLSQAIDSALQPPAGDDDLISRQLIDRSGPIPKIREDEIKPAE